MSLRGVPVSGKQMADRAVTAESVGALRQGRNRGGDVYLTD